MKKYKVNFEYVFDEEKSYKYDNQAKVFIKNIGDTGIAFVLIKPTLSDLKDSIIVMLEYYNERTESALLETSFNVKVYELIGINTDTDTVILNDFDVADSQSIYEGPLTNFGI